MNFLLTKIKYGFYPYWSLSVRIGQLAPAQAENCSLLILTYFLPSSWKSKRRLAYLFEPFKNTEYVEFEEVTPNEKKQNTKKKKKTNKQKKKIYLL